jgi:phosphoglycerate dehydrogenase-like enzyme
MKLLLAVHHKLEMWTVPVWFVEKLRAEFPQFDITHRNTYDKLEEYVGDVEILFTLSLRPDQFKAAKELKWLHCPAAAVHQFSFPEFVNSDVILTNGRDVHGPVVAEHVMALIFALAKNLHLSARFQQKHEWGQEPVWYAKPHPRLLAGATLGLVGLGSIGWRVARHASALGMRVIAVRGNPEKGSVEGVDEVFAPSQLNELLKQSDYVVLAAPVTANTQHLITADRLPYMKADACLINVGRGQLIDEPALIQALREKKIGGAALDVFEKEPLPSDSPFWSLDNVIITPHTAGLAEKLWEREYELFSENLRRYLAHQSLLALVDKRKGY